MTDPFHILIFALFAHISCSAYRGIKKQKSKGVEITLEFIIHYCAGHFLIWGVAILAVFAGLELIIELAI